MREHAQIFDLPGKLEHAKRSPNVTVDSLVEPGVEVDARSAVDDHIAILKQILEHFGCQPESLLLQIALSE